MYRFKVSYTANTVHGSSWFECISIRLSGVTGALDLAGLCGVSGCATRRTAQGRLSGTQGSEGAPGPLVCQGQCPLQAAVVGGRRQVRAAPEGELVQVLLLRYMCNGKFLDELHYCAFELFVK